MVAGYRRGLVDAFRPERTGSSCDSGTAKVDDASSLPTIASNPATGAAGRSTGRVSFLGSLKRLSGRRLHTGADSVQISGPPHFANPLESLFR